MIEEEQAYPINCGKPRTEGAAAPRHPYKLAAMGLTRTFIPVLYLWCKRHGKQHPCTLSHLLASFRQIAWGNRAAMEGYLAILRKTALDVQLDLDDLASTHTTGLPRRSC